MSQTRSSRAQKNVRLSKWRWAWPVVLMLLISLHFWFPSLGAGIQRDSYSTTAEGKKAIYYLLEADPEKRDISVKRNQDALVKRLADRRGEPEFYNELFDESPNASETFCLLGSARYPNRNEWGLLLNWVRDGGTLIIAARDAKPEFTIKELGISVTPIEREEATHNKDGNDVEGNDGAENGDEENGGKKISVFDKPYIESSDVTSALLDSAQLKWRSRGKIVSDSPRWDRQLVEVNGTVQAVRQRHGNGQVVVIASDFIFTNEAIAWGDHSNAELALKLLQYGAIPDGEIWDDGETSKTFVIDESLNVSGTPKVVGIFLNPLFKVITVQLLICLVLYGWWRSRRFGPLLPDAVSARHNIVDHTDSVGVLHFKSDDGIAALRAYLRQLFTEIKIKSFKGREEQVLAPIAARLGKSVDAVRQLLRSASKAARGRSLSVHRAAKLIRQLSRVLQASRLRVDKTVDKTKARK